MSPHENHGLAVTRVHAREGQWASRSALPALALRRRGVMRGRVGGGAACAGMLAGIVTWRVMLGLNGISRTEWTALEGSVNVYFRRIRCTSGHVFLCMKYIVYRLDT
jgi:hypothetical protein